MRLARLPGWVTDNDASVREDVSAFVRAGTAERWEAERRCCRAAVRMLSFQTGAARDRALAYRDPIAQSTLAALARLRKAKCGV